MHAAKRLCSPAGATFTSTGLHLSMRRPGESKKWLERPCEFPNSALKGLRSFIGYLGQLALACCGLVPLQHAPAL